MTEENYNNNIPGRGLGRGRGRGRQVGGQGLGPSGECVCPKCGSVMARSN